MEQVIPRCTVPVEISGKICEFALRPDRFYTRVPVDIWRMLKTTLRPVPPADKHYGDDFVGCLGLCTAEFAVLNRNLSDHTVVVSRDAIPTIGISSLKDLRLTFNFADCSVHFADEILTNTREIERQDSPPIVLHDDFQRQEEMSDHRFRTKEPEEPVRFYEREEDFWIDRNRDHLGPIRPQQSDVQNFSYQRNERFENDRRDERFEDDRRSEPPANMRPKFLENEIPDFPKMQDRNEDFRFQNLMADMLDNPFQHGYRRPEHVQGFELDGNNPQKPYDRLDDEYSNFRNELEKKRTNPIKSKNKQVPSRWDKPIPKNDAPQPQRNIYQQQVNRPNVPKPSGRSIDLEQVRAKVLNNYNRLMESRMATVAPPSQDVSLFARQNMGGKGPQPPHFDQRNINQQNAKKAKPKYKPRCTLCMKFGHLASACRTGKNAPMQSAGQGSNKPQAYNPWETW